MRKEGSQNESFVPLCYWGWVKVGQGVQDVETVEVNAMVALDDSTEEMIVVALGKVHMQEDMSAQVQDRNGVNGLGLSFLIAKIGRVVNNDISSHASNVESD